MTKSMKRHRGRFSKEKEEERRNDDGTRRKRRRKRERETQRRTKKRKKAEANKKEPVVQLSSSKSSPPKQENFEPIDLNNINTAQELERFGLDHLKIELTRQKLKCGGSLEEQANRLFLLKKRIIFSCFLFKKHKAKK